MMVYQSPKKHLNRVVELLGTKPRKPHPHTGVVCVPVSREDINELNKVFLHKSDLPGIVSKLSREAATAMFNAMIQAEASRHPKTGVVHFVQIGPDNAPVLEAFQMLGLMLGYSCNISKKGCYVRKKKYHLPRKEVTGKRQFSGMVWCPTTNNGTWLVRHNGCVCITGNSSRNLSYVAQELMTRPGGPLGMIIKTQARMHKANEMTPDYVAESLSIPITGMSKWTKWLEPKTPGTNRYLTGMGLMYEDPLQFLGGGVRGATLELLSRTAPWFKAPIEWATGQTTFQTGPLGGRPLEDLDPTLGRTLQNVKDLVSGQRTERVDPLGGLPLEFLVQASPLSQLAYSARVATDPRKLETPTVLAMNLLTGMRFSDISPNAREAIMNERIREQIKTRFKGRQFARTYIPKDELAKMTPEEKDEANRLTALMNELARRRKERAKALEEQQQKRGM